MVVVGLNPLIIIINIMIRIQPCIDLGKRPHLRLYVYMRMCVGVCLRRTTSNRHHHTSVNISSATSREVTPSVGEGHTVCMCTDSKRGLAYMQPTAAHT